MDFESARKQFERLSRLFRNGQIDQSEFIKGVDELAILDDQGVEWQIGMQSGRWYRKKGEDWIEDDPYLGAIISADVPNPKEKNSPRRGLLWGLIMLLVLGILLSPQWLRFGEYDKVGETGEFGPDDPEAVSNNSHAAPDNIDSLPSGSEELDKEDLFTETPTLDQPEIATNTGGQNASLPAITPTLPPPPAAYSPQVWEERVNLKLEEGIALSKDDDWYFIQDLPWEYEILSFSGRSALLLQFNQDVALWPAKPQITNDTDRKITLAFPRDEGSVSLVCRWDPNDGSGYAFRLTRRTWELNLYHNGIKTILAEGSQSNRVRNGEFETFRITCVGEEIFIWADDKLLAEVVDDRYAQGNYGLQFGVHGGLGVVFIAGDQVLVRNEDGSAPGIGKIIRLGPLEVQFMGLNRDYPQNPSSPYSGQNLIGVVLRVANNGLEPVQIDAENIYLRREEQKVFALAVSIDPPEEDDIPPLSLPLTLVSDEIIGEIFFVEVENYQIYDWQLVVDLRYEGFGEASFDLSK